MTSASGWAATHASRGLPDAAQQASADAAKHRQQPHCRDIRHGKRLASPAAVIGSPPTPSKSTSPAARRKAAISVRPARRRKARRRSARCASAGGATGPLMARSSRRGTGRPCRPRPRPPGIEDEHPARRDGNAAELRRSGVPIVAGPITGGSSAHFLLGLAGLDQRARPSRSRSGRCRALGDARRSARRCPPAPRARRRVLATTAPWPDIGAGRSRAAPKPRGRLSAGGAGQGADRGEQLRRHVRRRRRRGNPRLELLDDAGDQAIVAADRRRRCCGEEAGRAPVGRSSLRLRAVGSAEQRRRPRRRLPQLAERLAGLRRAGPSHARTAPRPRARHARKGRCRQDRVAPARHAAAQRLRRQLAAAGEIDGAQPGLRSLRPIHRRPPSRRADRARRRRPRMKATISCTAACRRNLRRRPRSAPAKRAGAERTAPVGAAQLMDRPRAKNCAAAGRRG